jgi:hypothetical protein
MGTDPDRAMSHGSPALAALIVSLGGALAGRALAGRTVLAWVVRRNERRDAD